MVRVYTAEFTHEVHPSSWYHPPLRTHLQLLRVVSERELRVRYLRVQLRAPTQPCDGGSVVLRRHSRHAGVNHWRKGALLSRKLLSGSSCRTFVAIEIPECLGHCARLLYEHRDEGTLRATQEVAGTAPGQMDNAGECWRRTCCSRGNRKPQAFRVETDEDRASMWFVVGEGSGKQRGCHTYTEHLY